MSDRVRALVTGAAGFVGSHICQMLLDQGAQVTGVDRVSEPWRLAALRDKRTFVYIAADATALRAQDWSGVDELWHFAANADIPLGLHDRQIDVSESVGLTTRLLDQCLAHDVRRFVFASSASVYGLNDGTPREEDTLTVRPQSMYAAGKIAAEAFIHAFHAGFDIDATILRFGNLLGPSMERGIVLDFVRRLLEDPTNLKVLGDGLQAKSYIDVRDASAAAWTLSRHATAPEARVFNVAAGDVATTRQ